MSLVTKAFANPGKLAKNLKEFTANNNTGDALVLLATAMDNKVAAEKMESINRRQERAGCLTEELKRERWEIYLELKEDLKNYGQQVYLLIYTSL